MTVTEAAQYVSGFMTILMILISVWVAMRKSEPEHMAINLLICFMGTGAWAAIFVVTVVVKVVV